MTACVKCGGGSFTLKLFDPTNGNKKLNMVQCAMCGAPAGVVEYYDAGTLLKAQEKAIADLGRRLSLVEQASSEILELLRRR